MNILFLVTHTPNCEPFWRSLEAIGHEVRVEQYDNRPHDRHFELVDLVKTTAPNVVVYIGAYAPSHMLPVPSTDTLSRIRDACPFILLCGDAADEPWWPVLEDYHRKQCFTTIVALDGNPNTPIAGFSEGLTLLTPIDTRVYAPLSWDQRTIRLGMVGGMGHRGGMVNDLRSRGLIEYFPGPSGRSYAEFAKLLCQTKITLNLAQTGTGKYLHVKGRVVEAGFAGSTVMETRGSPLSTWGFKPGEDYLEYDSIEDIVSLLANTDDGLLEEMAFRFNRRMTSYHNPGAFWAKVFAKCQLSR